jgi:hypothetical protein
MEEIMGLSIRNPRAELLARKLAKQEGTTMTAVIVEALEQRMRHNRLSISERLDLISQRALAMAKPGGHKMTKEEIDAMWGQ